MTQSDDLPSRIGRAEDNIIDLRLAASALVAATEKNSADIAALIEFSRRNSEGIARLIEANQRSSERIVAVEEAIQDIRRSNASTNAAIERMDRLLDYLIRRDQGQAE